MKKLHFWQNSRRINAEMPNKKNKTKRINPNKCLPPELTVESVDDILYEIGFNLDSNRDRPKIQIVYNPVIKFSFLSLYLFNVLYNSFKEESDPSSKMIVPFAELMGVTQDMLWHASFASLLSLSSQFKFRYNPFDDGNDRALGVLRMVSGSVPPIRLGLKNEQQIRRLVKITKFCLKFNDIQNKLGLRAFYILFIIYSTNSLLKELALSLEIINAILFTIWMTYVAGNFNNLFIRILINGSFLID